MEPITKAPAIRDRYVLSSAAIVSLLLLICAIGSFGTGGADGTAEITGVISDPSATQNGTVFTVTDLSGNEIRCFYRYAMPEMPVLCKLTGNFSPDGRMFFADRIVICDR
jgi:hypothetical protein